MLRVHKDNSLRVCVGVCFFFSMVGYYYETLTIVPCAIQYDLVVYLFYIWLYLF